MVSAFQWLVALRYLRLQRLRSAKMHWISVGLALALGAVLLGSRALEHARTVRWQEFRVDHAHALLVAPYVLGILLALVEVFLQIVRRFTIFSTISTYGLF